MNEVLVARDDLETWQMNAQAVADTLDLIREAVSTASCDINRGIGSACWVLGMFMEGQADELMTAKNRREATA